MKCPECDYDMGKKASKVTRSSAGKSYNWVQYHCQRDDVWIELETPVDDTDK
jgi:hypothetical protein